MSIQPPLDVAPGPAPAGVCSRWMGSSPCGAAGTRHVIWDSEMTNGCVCTAHAEEIRRNWVYLGLHPYTVACAAPGRAEWLSGEDRCVLPGSGEDRPARRAAVNPPVSLLL
jgi:hypothetical protein